jgi:hypothetical protein
MTFFILEHAKIIKIWQNVIFFYYCIFQRFGLSAKYQLHMLNWMGQGQKQVLPGFPKNKEICTGFPCARGIQAVPYGALDSGTACRDNGFSIRFYHLIKNVAISRVSVIIIV